MRSHAAVPFAAPAGEGLFRVYFSSRDDQQRSRTFAAVLDLARPDRLLDLVTDPLLDLGELGGFDDSGAMLSGITPLPDATELLYFQGWNLGVTVPFRNSVGVAIFKGGDLVERFRGPAMDRTLKEPHFVGTPCVLREEHCFRCWYLACTGWERMPAGARHRYHIRYAESPDGLCWERDGKVAIDFAGPEEFAISRPSVLKHGGRYRMWFSCRGSEYRIGYAESSDGITWERDDAAVGLGPAGEGWDGAAVAYPHVFEHRDSLFMLYNGDGYGLTGFGLAVLE